ncbi:MAG: NAD-binding protein, partial [Candidatus Methanosuratincola sp.]
MRIIIVGGGAVGTFLAKNLCNENDVIVIDSDKETYERINATLNVLALHGEGDDPSVLKSARLDEAEVVLAVSGDDRVNILASILSHAM